MNRSAHVAEGPPSSDGGFFFFIATVGVGLMLLVLGSIYFLERMRPYLEAIKDVP